MQIFSLYSIKINIAVKDSGGNNNPETNSTLKKLIDEALAQNVPKSTIEKIVKNSKANLDESSEYLYLFTLHDYQQVEDLVLFLARGGQVWFFFRFTLDFNNILKH